MDVSHLLVGKPHSAEPPPQMPVLPPPQDHIYSTRRASSSLQSAMAGPYVAEVAHHSLYPGPSSPAHQHHGGGSPSKAMPKTVSFQLLLSDVPHHRARLPLRVHIQPHDTTDSIITTVKNFYGLYEGEGVSFQDRDGITLIAQYQNLEHNSTIYVRITAEPAADAAIRRATISPRKSRLGEPFQMPPPQHPHPTSRPNSRASKKRSTSPSMRRSLSARAQTQLQTKLKPKTLGRNGSHDENDGTNGMSDSDAGSVSVTSSRREQLASADISLDNIVEGGRRKRAKFESSELPLFAPPQQGVTTSISSMSPQRKPNTTAHSPLNNSFNFSYGNPLPSPQSFGQVDYITSAQLNYGSQQGNRTRGRTYSVHGPSRLSGGSTTGLLPTPDPTIGSVISDEDVALQLMRLGDASMISHGRTSTSTLDETLSGKADAASSNGETDIESAPGDNGHGVRNITTQPSRNPHMPHPVGHARKKLKAIDAVQTYYESDETSEDNYEDNNDGSFNGESDELGPDALGITTERSRPRSQPPKPRSDSVSVKGSTKPRVPSLGKTKSSKSSSSSSKIPPSPYGAPVPVRKGSSASTINMQQGGPDDDDLSSKPRCQRCRKSKKGCDRQRPCQRCKDAGIGVDGCVSEDEGNGRKGRYGRHMGVPVKKNSMDAMMSIEQGMDFSTLPAYSPEINATDAGKKRKR